MDLFDIVEATTDLERYGVARGDGGVILFVYDDNAGYEVEFFTMDGTTKAFVAVGAGGVCAMSK